MEKIGIDEWSKLGILNHFGPLEWEKIAKSVKWPKLGILNHSGPLWWENIGTSAKWSKLNILNDFGPLWWEKIGKGVKWSKLSIPNHFGPLWWEKMGKVENNQNWAFQIILDHFGRKRLEKVKPLGMYLLRLFYSINILCNHQEKYQHAKFSPIMIALNSHLVWKNNSITNWCIKKYILPGGLQWWGQPCWNVINLWGPSGHCTVPHLVHVYAWESGAVLVQQENTIREINQRLFWRTQILMGFFMIFNYVLR